MDNSDKLAEVTDDNGPATRRAKTNRLGRKRDHTRDAAILNAALDVLAEAGYEGFTIDMVAVRARAGKATVYRRWSTKAELVLDAIAHLKRNQVDLDKLPDSGTLRGDLLGLFKPQSTKEAQRKLKVMAGLTSMLVQHQNLADAATSVMVDPWIAAHRALMQRAVDRGEVSASADIATASQIVPSMAAYRALIQRKPFSKDFLLSLIDGVVLPALGITTLPSQKEK
jgi:AcrR family transcriptional regulator